MVIRVKFLSAFFLILFFFVSAGFLNAQYENKNTADLKAEALKSFSSGDYSAALTQYRSLLKRYPKDGVFSYYCGLSLLNMNKDLAGAIDYLEFASSKAQVPYQVSYYLGVAYSRNYQFLQAKKAYDQFTSVATKTEAKELVPARLSEMSANAIELTRYYNQVDVQASSLFSFSDSGYVGQVRAPGGKLSEIPSKLMPVASDNVFAGLMFIPRNTIKGDILFYSGYGKSKKRGLEIYMVKAGNGDNYGEPVLVDDLNSDYDEILPYYDPVGKDLYFASKGHSSMGGFDIFKSHFDPERNLWTPPMNLGFPLNSPSDDYLAIPGTDMGSIMIITNRQGLDSLVTAYMLRIHEPRRQFASADPAELKRVGKFGGIESIPDMVDMSSEDILAESVTESAVVISPPVERPKISPATGNLSEEYRNYLRIALEQQFKADSLARLARETRIKVKDIPDPDERWAIQKNIISWEKQSADFQAKADEYYLKLKNPEKPLAEVKKIPEAIVKDTVINDITVYNYKASEIKAEAPETQIKEVIAPEQVIPAPVVENKPKPAAAAPLDNPSKEVNRFSILEKSPYSVNNPFPSDTEIPKGAYYKIQLAVLSKNPEWNAFGGISPITYENVEGKPMKRYYAGKFSKYESAKAALEIVRNNGFKDALIVGWFDGVKMNVTKVAGMEN